MYQSPFLPERHHISILDGGADTCALSKGWEIISTHNSRRENVVSFDHETIIKRNLPTSEDIVSLNSTLWQKVIHHGFHHHFLIKLCTLMLRVIMLEMKLHIRN
jgi:hypothetical protein